MVENLNQESSQTVAPEVKTEPTVPIVAPIQTTGKGWKIAILISVFVLAGSIVYSGYQFSQKPPPLPLPTPTPVAQPSPTPTPDQTANWKTFADNKYRFSFKYPDYFQYVHPNVEFIGGAYLAPKEGTGESKGSPTALESQDVWLSITTNSGANISSLEDFFNLQGQGAFFQYEYTNSKKQKMVIAGLNGYKIILDEPFMPNPTQSTVLYEGVVLKNGYIYHVNLYAFNKETLNKFEKVFDQILSTFKFLE